MTEGRQTVAGAYAEIESHEKLCAERYTNIHGRITDQGRSLDTIIKLLVALFIGVTGWLAVQVYGTLKPAPAPSTQTMVMQQPAAAPAPPVNAERTPAR